MIFGRTQLILGLSEAKNCKEAAGDARFHPNSPKRDKKPEKRNAETEKFRKKKLGVEKSNVGNHLKRVLAKFRANRSHPRG